MAVRTTCRLPSTSVSDIATNTVCGSSAPAGSPTTRKLTRQAEPRPSTFARLPSRTAATSSGNKIGTSRSPPGDAARTRSSESTTCTSGVPAATGIGSGSCRLSTRAATSRARWRADSSSAATSDLCSATSSRTVPASSARATSAVATTVRRARRLSAGQRGPLLRTATGTWFPASAVTGQPPFPASRYPAPRTVCSARRPNGASIFRRRYPDVNLDDVGVAVVVRIPHVRQDLRLRQHLVRMAHEQLEQRELTRGQ